MADYPSQRTKLWLKLIFVTILVRKPFSGGPFYALTAGTRPPSTTLERRCLPVTVVSRVKPEGAYPSHHGVLER